MISHFYLTFLVLYLTLCDSYLTNPHFLRLSSKEKCIGMESSPPADCSVGGRHAARSITESGLARMGEILSDDYGRLSYDFAFLSYVFGVVSYGFRFLSYEYKFPPTLIETSALLAESHRSLMLTYN